MGAYSHKLNNPNCSMTWLFVLLTNSPLSMEQSTPLVPRPTCSVSYFIVYNEISVFLDNFLLSFLTKLDVASGGSDDWAKGGAGIPYAYTVEMRDTGTFAFELPAE